MRLKVALKSGMDYGLIELNNIALRLDCEGCLQQMIARSRSATTDNANANSNRTSSNANRPGPSNSRNGLFGQNEIKSRSLASLTKSISFETPYGVIRQSSSSTIEPERIHSVTSQDSFKREISLYKMQPMPVLAEDGQSSDEDTKVDAATRRRQFSKKGRQKGRKTRCEGNLEEIDLEHDDLNDINIEIEMDEQECDIGEEMTQKKTRKSVFVERFRNLFSCTRKHEKKSVDSVKLIQMEESTGKTET